MEEYNKGKLWTFEDTMFLIALFRYAYSNNLKVQPLAIEALGRSDLAIKCKLKSLGILNNSTSVGKYSSSYATTTSARMLGGLTSNVLITVNGVWVSCKPLDVQAGPEFKLCRLSSLSKDVAERLSSPFLLSTLDDEIKNLYGHQSKSSTAAGAATSTAAEATSTAAGAAITETKELNMKAFEIRVYINGQIADNMTVEAVLNAAHAIAIEIANLKSMPVESKKKDKLVADKEEMLKQIIDYLDAR